MQQTFTTPMMKQYFKIKKQYEDCLLFFRAGDFYELFLEDAVTGARVLNITLTKRANSKDGNIPMAGVPYHAVDAYLSKLIKAGYKVAICEQVSLPSKTGIVDREVVRIVTPGTVLDEKALEKKDNNYIISLSLDKKSVAMTVADISTGYFATTQIETENFEQTIKDELARIHPKECILPEELYNDPQLLKFLKKEKDINIFPFLAWNNFSTDAVSVLKKHFGVATLACFNIEEKALALQTSAALLGYLQQTQKGPVNHIKKISSLSGSDFLILDRSTIINLELFSTIREHTTFGTLISVIDHTVTAMGGRLLKQWIKKPLTNKKEITARYDSVESLIKEMDKGQKLRESIKEVSDIERILSRLSVGLGNGRDLINLISSLKMILEVKEIMKTIPSSLLLQTAKNISGEISEIITYVEINIVPEPPISLREGGIIMTGVNAKLDKLRKIVGGSRDWILDLEKKEREKTGISSLKIRYNQVFGFYIEISKPNLHLVPANYMRKQTLVNGERFITEELKVQEEIILTAEEKINDLEYKIFQEVLAEVLSCVAIIQEAAQSVAVLDCLLNFAYIAQKNNYNRPNLQNSGKIQITGGRHPVVEQLLEEKQFVPNDVLLGDTTEQLLLITGPNMAGKSVLIRQIAVIVLMAHMGSYVPAQKADICLVDRIFVRSGASDVITSGLSTFMVEMVETAHILHHATKNSLIIMDEIGRGTSTYDGISIAWAIAEYLVTHTEAAPKTLFATHYHELQVLEEQYPGKIKNFHMAVADDKGEPIFLYTLLPGGASHSFGVAVAKLAGIPDIVILRANTLLEELEKRQLDPQTDKKNVRNTGQIDFAERVIQKEIEQLDISQMTPLEALNILAHLKEKLRIFTVQEKEFLEIE